MVKCQVTPLAGDAITEAVSKKINGYEPERCDPEDEGPPKKGLSKEEVKSECSENAKRYIGEQQIIMGPAEPADELNAMKQVREKGCVLP